MGMEAPIDELHNVLEMTKETAVRLSELMANDLAESISDETPFVTGNLRSGWDDPTPTGELSYIFRNNVEYALAVHEGSRPHIIEGNPYLSWPGAKHPVRMVHHPGYGGNPFTEPAILSTEGKIDDLLSQALSEVGAV
jgi:hypothetical protein